MTGPPSPAPNPEDEIVNTRLFTASREHVFTAFSNPAALARWWGPQGFTNTIKTFDLRAGGEWRFVMHGPDGTDYPNESEFIEVVFPERVVLVHHRPMHRYYLTMTFETGSGQTRLTWRMRFEDANEHRRLRDFIHAANEQNLDRLGAVLSAPAGSS